MTRPDADRGLARERARGPFHAVLAVALLAITALVRVPIQLYQANRQDFSEASGEVLLVLFGCGLLVSLLLGLAVVWTPRRLRPLTDAALVGLAFYAWIRASFFPGPSVNLDGSPLTVELSTGAAGLLVPIAAALLLAWLARRQGHVGTTILAVLLGGALVQSAVAAGSAWHAGPRTTARAASSLLEWSRQGNVLIYILDTLQEDVFEDVLQAEPHLREGLDGFRLYREAAANSRATHLSLPSIHSGLQYQQQLSAHRFFEESIRERSVLNRFAEAGHAVSYAISVGPCPRAVTDCISTPVLGRSRGAVGAREAAQLVDLGLYRVLPDVLRRKILQRGQGLLAGIVGKAYRVDPIQSDLAALERLASSSVVSDSPPTVKMVHSMITHQPAILQADCSIGERRSDRPAMIAQARCAFRPVMALLERLKADEVYDVTDIVLMADHGYGFASPAVTRTRDARFSSMVGAFNPMVLVKPAHARGPLVTSDARIELADLAGALCGQGECSPSEGLRGLGNVDPGRVRRLFWYVWKHEYQRLPRIPGLIEYAVRGDLADPAGWSREAAEYTLGERLDFRRGRQNSSRYLGIGWGVRRPAHQEMVDPQATLRLRASFEPARRYEMVLEAQLYDATPAEPERIEVLVNGAAVGTIVAEGTDETPREYRLRIPGTALAGPKVTTITFSAPGAAPDREPMAVQTFELRPLSGSAAD